MDPRSRILAAVGFSVIVALCHRPAALGVGLAAGVAAVGLAGLRPGEVLRRLAPLELLMLLLVVVLPWTASGATIAIGPFDVSQHGLALAAAIAVKGNAIMLALLGLLGTMDEIRLGHALLHLRVPDKLAHLLLFTVRYLGVLRDEHCRLTDAMRVRGFRPGPNRHTCQTYGYLVGMLLARGFDRTERIAAAMKCRGFRGRFYLLDHFVFSRIDVPFAAATVGVIAAIVFLEWT
ncbi:MAG: cobalt ECF transporter T component CbiQ [Pirellulales bacterium]|nr:cobalt ECF transporter T component CbiQ [Pirellulales bacterium]